MAGGRPGLRLDPDFFPFAVGRSHPPSLHLGAGCRSLRLIAIPLN